VVAAPPSTLPAQVEQLVNRAAGGPLICVHPAAGNAMKQWPADYFALVVDRLIATHGARIALIGAPGKEPIANELLARLRRPEAVTSLIGALPLAARWPARPAVPDARRGNRPQAWLRLVRARAILPYFGCFVARRALSGSPRRSIRHGPCETQRSHGVGGSFRFALGSRKVALREEQNRGIDARPIKSLHRCTDPFGRRAGRGRLAPGAGSGLGGKRGEDAALHPAG